MEKIKQKSRKTSKKRLALQKARELDLNSQIVGTVNEIEEKQRSADKNREAKRRLQEEKKRQREERTKQTLERAKKQKEINNGGMDYNEVEKDEKYNDDSKILKVNLSHFLIKIV